MAYEKNDDKLMHKENAILTAVIIFSIFMLALDCGLIIKFINVIKSI